MDEYSEVELKVRNGNNGWILREGALAQAKSETKVSDKSGRRRSHQQILKSQLLQIKQIPNPESERKFLGGSA